MIPQVQESDQLYIYQNHSQQEQYTGQHAEPIHGSVNVPIHLRTTYKQRGLGQSNSSFDYTRCGNPTREALEECIADLENNKHSISFSSGCAAMP